MVILSARFYLDAANLAKAANIGFEVLYIAKSGNKPEGDWVKQKLAELALIGKTHGENRVGSNNGNYSFGKTAVKP